MAALAGLVAGGLGLGVAELLAGLLPGAASPVLAIGSLLIALQPPNAKQLVVDLFGDGGQAGAQPRRAGRRAGAVRGSSASWRAGGWPCGAGRASWRSASLALLAAAPRPAVRPAAVRIVAGVVLIGIAISRSLPSS